MRPIPLFRVAMSAGATEAAGKVLASGYVGQGPVVERFEAELGKRFGTTNVSTVNCCTSALQLAFHLCRDSQRDEVLTTPLTCTATNTAILAAGLKPRWVDVDPFTGNVDLFDLERKLSERTRAICVVHWGGNPCEMNHIQRLAERCGEMFGNRPAVIADCAHAWGATYRGESIARWADFSCFSFGAIKHLTTVDGGALVCADPEQHRRAKLLRWYGLDRESSSDFRCAQNIKEAGYKFHMNDVAAAVGLANIAEADRLLGCHRENALWFDEHLPSWVEPMVRCPESEPSYWIYTVRVQKRDDFARAMQDRGIHVSRVHDRNDKHQCFESSRAMLPGLDALMREMICLPCGWWVSDEDRQYIVDCINKGW